MPLAPVLLAGASVANAQQATSAGLEEVIVTAQKRHRRPLCKICTGGLNRLMHKESRYGVGGPFDPDVKRTDNRE